MNILTHKKSKPRVIVAMSGGVDSSVAAALLKKQGYDVIGIFMKLWAEPAKNPTYEAGHGLRENICCSVEASTAARAVAQKLDIPFYVVNFSQDFKKLVVDYYIKEYEAGRTPNPCVICNRDIKGKLLFNKMKELGGDFLATGHYARISELKSQKSKVKNTIYKLYQGIDKNKDQTYFLWALTQEKLAHLLFPVSDLTKPEVRALARKFNLPTAEKRESQGICFIPDRDVAGFLGRYAKKLIQPGPIHNLQGEKVGEHNGLISYTIGQREGLGLGGPQANYVLQLNIRDNILIVGDDKDLYRSDLIATDLNLLTEKQKLTGKNISARIRHGQKQESCQLEFIDENCAKVHFCTPQRAITPGQSIVFYQKEELLGGGVIK